MSRTTIILLSVIGLLLVSFVCVLALGYAYLAPRPTPLPAETVMMQTIDAALTQTAQIPTMAPSLIPTDTLPFTLTPDFSTVTPSATLPPVILFTPTPSVPLITVSVDTNCRVGPGKVYTRVGWLLVGQVSEIYGRNPAGDYWYIRNLNQNTEYCWLWGEYAIVSGNIAALPIFTPPPTPTPVPNFMATYVGTESCSGWWVDIRMENTGGVTFRSSTFTVRDTETGTSLTQYSDGFTDNNGCSDSSTVNALSPGNKKVVSSPAFSYNPSGHEIRATITLCSNTGQSGTCVTQVIEFDAD